MKEVLDIGAGRWVAPGATRAIDPKKKYYVMTQRLKGEIVKPSSLQEYRAARAERIPYPSGFFNKVVSRWALGVRIYSRRAYREIARVLKPNGRVEVRLQWKDRRYKRRIIDRLAEVGIKIYAEYTGVYEGDRDGHRHQLTEFIICGRKDGAKGRTGKAN